MHLLPPGSGFDFATMTPSPGWHGPIAEAGPRRPDVPDLRGDRRRAAVPRGRDRRRPGRPGRRRLRRRTPAVPAPGSSCSPRATPRRGDAQTDAKAIAAALAPMSPSVSWFALDSRTKNAEAIAAINDATGIIVTGRDRSLVLEQLDASPAWDRARQRWTDGLPLLADDAAAAAAGTAFVAQAPAADVESGATEDAIVDNVTIADGLGLVSGLAVEPRLLPDQLWPQLFQISQSSGDAGSAPASTSARRSAWTAHPRRRSATAPSSSSTAGRRRGRPGQRGRCCPRVPSRRS